MPYDYPTKHRLAKVNFGFDFGKRLEVGEQLTGTPEVVITLDGEDVTAEFGALNLQIVDGQRSGKTNAQVSGTLHVALGDDQDEATYKIRIEVDTTAGQHLVGMIRDPRTGEFRLPLLPVLEEGDPDAP